MAAIFSHKMLIPNDLDSMSPPSDWCFQQDTFAALIHPKLEANSSHIGSSQALEGILYVL